MALIAEIAFGTMLLSGISVPQDQSRADGFGGLAQIYLAQYNGPGSGSGRGRYQDEEYTGPGSGTGRGRYRDERYTGPGSGTGMGRCRTVFVEICRPGYGDGRGPRCYVERQQRC